MKLKILGPLAIGMIALFLAGLVTGPIGEKFFGIEPLIPQPKIHLPPDAVIPAGKHLQPVSLSTTNWVITNTILASWVTMLFLALFFYLATRRMKLVPGRLQSVAEALVEMLHNLVMGIVGRERGKTIFPLVATIFLFVGFNAWLSIIPVYGPIGFRDEHGLIEKALLRNANTDLNLPLSLALIAVIAVEFWGMRYVGARPYLGQFFNFRNLLRGRPLGIIDLFIGLLEILSHFIRIISFTFRLFGNMTAGKTLLLISAFLVPFVLAIPFYGLELLIGLVQALIFAGLTLAFSAIALTPHEEEGH